MDRSNKIAINNALDSAYAVLAPWSEAHRHERYYYQLVIEEAIKYCPPDNKKIIDIGSGIGILALALRGLGYEVDGVEKYVFSDTESPMFKAGQIENLKRVWDANGFNVYNFDVTAMPLSHLCGCYDAVVTTAVIEHVKEPRALLGTIWQLLKPGGIAVTMTPNVAVFYKRLRFLFGKSPWWPLNEFFSLGGAGFVGHWREYTMAELALMHEWSGFKIIASLNRDIYSLTRKRNLRNFFHLLVRYIFYFIPDSREINIIVAQKL